MRKYTDDYEMVVTTDENGREKQTAVYRGDYYEIPLDEEGIVSFKRYCLLLLATIVVFHVGSGFVNNQGMYQFYIIFPYVFAFFPLMYLTAGVFHLPKEKRKYKRAKIGLSFDRMKASSLVLIIFLGLGVVGEIVFLLFFSSGKHNGLDYLYLTLQLLVISVVYILINLQKKIPVQKYDKQ